MSASASRPADPASDPRRRDVVRSTPPRSARRSRAVPGRRRAPRRVPDPPRRGPRRRRPRRQPRHRLPGRGRAAGRAAGRDTRPASCCGPSGTGSWPRSAGPRGRSMARPSSRPARGPATPRRWTVRQLAGMLDAAADGPGAPRSLRGRRQDDPRHAAPAAAAFEAASVDGRPLARGVRARPSAPAADGARSTRPLVARRGLALRLGERSAGHLDPGAVSCAPAAARPRRPLSRPSPVTALTSRPWTTATSRSLRARIDAARARAAPRLRGGPARGRRPVRPVPAEPAPRLGRDRGASSARPSSLELVRLAGAAGGALYLQTGDATPARPHRHRGRSRRRTPSRPSRLDDLEAGRAWTASSRRPRDRALGDRPDDAARRLAAAGRQRSTTTGCASPSSPATSSPSRSPGARLREALEHERQRARRDRRRRHRPHPPGRCRGPGRPPQPGRRAAARHRRRPTPLGRTCADVLGCEVAGGHGAGHCPLAEVRAIGRPDRLPRDGRPGRRRLAGPRRRQLRRRRRRRPGRAAGDRHPARHQRGRGRSRSCARASSPRSATSCARRSRSSAATPRRSSTSTSSRAAADLRRAHRRGQRAAGGARRPGPRRDPPPGRPADPRAVDDDASRRSSRGCAATSLSRAVPSGWSSTPRPTCRRSTSTSARVGQVLSNLVGNALKYAPDGSPS